MKVDVENKQYEYDKNVYVEPTKLEKTAMNKENKYFGLAKLKIKSELIKNLSKDVKNKRYILKSSRLKKISDELYDEINNLNLALFLESSQLTYENKYKELDSEIDKDKLEEKKPTDSTINKWLNEFFGGDGINYIYLQEVARRSDYFNTQITNVIMNNINTKISDELSKENNKLKTNSDIQDFIKNNLDMNAKEILDEIKRQKKFWGQITDDTLAIIINKSILQAFKDNGIKKVVRVAIIDDKTCNECKKLNGQVYDIDNIPKLIIHRNDRCIYKEYKG